MIDPVFFATVEKGKILFADKDLLKIRIDSFEGQDIDVIIRKHRKDRTRNQNAWYRKDRTRNQNAWYRKDRTRNQNAWYWTAVVGIPAQHFGYQNDEMHNAFKWMFLLRHEEGKPDTVRSTAKLSTIEFTEYVERCRQWCAEQGILIPDPHEIYVPE